MKNRFTKLTAVLALLAFLAVPLGMRGQTRTEVTWTASEQGYSNGASLDDVSIELDDYITIQFDKNDGNNPPAYYNTGTAARLYSKNSLTVTPASGYQITGMTLTFSGTGYTGTLGASVGAYSLSSTTGTWSGSSTSAIVLTNNASSGHARLQELTVTYSDSGTPVPTTYAVTYDCNGGTSGCPENVTGIEGGTTINLAEAPTKDGFDFDGWSNGNTTYNAGDEYTVNGNVTFTAQWVEQSSGDVQWILTNLVDLTESDVFVIVGNNGGNYAMANDKGTSSAPTAVSVTVENDAITGMVAANIQWNISGNATNGYTFYPNGTTESWLYCTNTNNGVRVGTNNDKTFKVDGNSGYLKHDGTSRYVGIYNSQDWRCYTTTGGNIADQTFAFYKKVTGGVLPPSITAANVEISYDATNGSIAYTINNEPDPAGTLTAATESDWLTLGEVGENVPFTCTANASGTERTATVTLTYTYNRETVSKDVTVTQAGDPNATMTIAEVRAQGTGSVVTKGTITSISGNGTKTAYIQDATAAIVVYGSFTAAVGDEIRVSGTLTTYQGLMEITNPTVTVISQGNTIDPELMTIAEINASTNQGWYIRVEDATVTAISGPNTTIAQGDNTILVYGNLGVTVEVNDVVSLNGNIGNHNGVQITNPQNVEVQVAPAVPSITVTPNVLNVDAGQHLVNLLSLTYENIVDDSASYFSVHYYNANGEEISLVPGESWMIAGVVKPNDDYQVLCTIIANEGEARTAYFKVSALDADDNTVYSNLVTVNQEAYVAPSYAELPFAFNSGRAAIEETEGLSQEGLGSDYGTENTKLKFDGTGDWLLLQFNERPGTLTFDIKGNSFSGSTFTVQTSEDGTTYTDLATYTDTELTSTVLNEEFTDLGENVRYIKWIYTNKASGNVGLGNITLAEYVEPVIVASITVNPDVVNVNAEEHDGTLTLAYENLTITEMSDFDIQYYNAEGQEAETPDWIEILVAEQDPQIGEGYVVSYYMIENEGEARTAYFKVYAMDDETNLVHSNLVTINQAAYEAPVASITFDPDFLNFDSELHYDGALPFTYENIIVENAQSFGLQFYTAEGEETVMPEWFFAMVTPRSNENNGEYQVSCAIMANEGEARSVYFKVYVFDADSIPVYSNLATVNQAAPVFDYAVLPFVWEGGSSADFAALNGVTLSGNGSDYNSNHSPYLIKLDGTGDYIQVKTDSQPGTVTIGVKMIGGGNTSTITIQGSADGETFTDIEELTISGAQNDTLTLETTNAFDANDRYVRMLFTKGSNVGVGPITIAKGTAPSITVTPDTFDLEAVGPLNGNHLPSMMVSYNNFEIAQASDFNYQFYNAEGEEQEMPEWIPYSEVSLITETSYQAICIVTANDGPARSAYFKLYAFDADSIPVYSNLVTINQAGVPQPSITFDPDVVDLEAEMQTIQIPFTYENIEVTNYESFTVHHYDAEGEEIQPNPETPWYVFGVTGSNDEGYKLSGLVTANEGEARSAYMKVSALDAAGDTVFSNLVTINQAGAPAPTTTYTRATTIEPGRHYIIVAMNGDDAYAMGGQNSNNRAAVSITVEDGVAQVSSNEVHEFVINTVGFTDEVDPYSGQQSGGSGMASYPGYWQYTIYDPADLGYLYAASSSSNYLRTETHLDAKDNGVWSIEIYDENVAHIVAFGNNDRKVMRFNSSGNGLFSCYGTDNNMKDIYLYVKDEDVPQYDFYKDISGYGTSNGGYCLMATPTTENANPNLVGMITDDGTNPENCAYDLYSFDFTQEQEWRNYRADAFNYLLNGHGYLYANQSNVTLHFQGASCTSKTVNLQLGDTNYDWNGWNLIGNPLSDVAWVGTDNFYVMNVDGTELELAGRSYVNPMEGIFVKAIAANQSIYFTNDYWYYNELGEKLNLRVSGNNGSGDLARVHFGEGQDLEKFMLNPNHTKLYFSQSNKDYAVVSSANEGEMPVNFKAENNGSYTITVDAENMEMNYLHLIDNMTGADVDLLVNPSYSFEAKKTDYASRFRLVFSANNSNIESGNETFAFFNGSEWCISNQGEATLQVIDMMGRIVSSQTINGNAEFNVNETAGVYMLRLVNGENVKVQKVVVR